MKICKICRGLSLLPLIFLVAGCAKPSDGIVTPSLVAPTLVTTKPFKTDIVTPNSTHSATRTATVNPIPTNTATGTSTPSYTSPSIPTLPADDAYQRLLNLLKNNGGCSLPCVWGITPGKSTNQQSESILSPLSSISSDFEIRPNFDTTGGFVDLSHSEGQDDLFFITGVSYSSNNQTVRFIHFYAREEKIPTDSNGNWLSRGPFFDFPPYYTRVEYYSLSHVLYQQGMPTSVLVQASPLRDYSDKGIIDIALLYPEQGIWVNYEMTTHTQSGVRKGCPANANFEMYLYPPGNIISFFSLLDGTDWGVIKVGYKAINLATSMSVEQFYQTFRNPTDQCIETPDNIWPTMEPGGDWPRP